MSVLYQPKGHALEYGELAVNLYSGGCPHKCVYCYVPGCLRKTREQWEATPCVPRPGVDIQLAADLARWRWKHDRYGQTSRPQVFMCFTGDPFPMGVDHDTTLIAIDLCHQAGFGVRLLTKNGVGALKALHLLDERDAFGITAVAYRPEIRAIWEPDAPSPILRLDALKTASLKGVPTWLSIEPVVDLVDAKAIILDWGRFADEIKIGRLNHTAEAKPYDWAHIANELVALCKEMGLRYTLKKGLREYISEAQP
jgi:DNA repair photolyase